MVHEYECVDYALPRRKMEKYHKGKLYKAGINRQTGKDTHDITKLYPRVDKSGRAVFKNRRELTEFFSHESVKAAGYFYDR